MNRRHFISIALPASLAGATMGADRGNSNLRFGVIADPQYVDAPNKGSRFYRKSPGKLKAAAVEFNKHELNFVVTLGDVIDRDLASFKTIMPIYQTFKAPCRFVLGNHDFAVADRDKLKVLKQMTMRQSYYSEAIGDWHFIYLDGNDVSTYRHPKASDETKTAIALLKKFKEAKQPQAQLWNGGLGAKQLAWLTQELATATRSNKRIIVFNHFPVFPLNKDHNLWNDREVVELIAKHPNVIAYMNGHNHSGHYAKHKHCHYLNFKGMVETEKKNAYAIVSCLPDRIEVDGFEMEPDRKLG